MDSRLPSAYCRRYAVWTSHVISWKLGTVLEIASFRRRHFHLRAEETAGFVAGKSINKAHQLAQRRFLQHIVSNVQRHRDYVATNLLAH